MSRNGDPGAGSPEDRLRELEDPDGEPGTEQRGDRDGAGRTDADADATAVRRVRAELAAAPAASVPPAVLARLDRALAAERADAPDGPTPGAPPSPPVTSPPSHASRWSGPSRARRRRTVLTTLGAAAALVVLVVGIGLTARGGPGAGPAPVAIPPDTVAPSAPTGPSALPVRAVDLPAALGSGLGARDYGPLADPGRLAPCLAAHGVAPALRPAGGRRVVLDGRAGVLLVLPTGVSARFRVLVVGEECSSVTPATLADRLVGPAG